MLIGRLLMVSQSKTFTAVSHICVCFNAQLQLLVNCMFQFSVARAKYDFIQKESVHVKYLSRIIRLF